MPMPAQVRPVYATIKDVPYLEKTLEKELGGHGVFSPVSTARNIVRMGLAVNTLFPEIAVATTGVNLGVAGGATAMATTSGTALAVGAFALPVLGAVLGIWGSLAALTYAMHASEVAVGRRGQVYGMVSWAYGHGALPMPAQIKHNLENSHLADRADKMQAYRTQWTDGVAQGMQSMSALAKQHKTPEADLKGLLRALGGPESQNGPQNLAAGLMLLTGDANYNGWFNYSTEFRDFLTPYSMYPDDETGPYGLCPDYPPKIKAKYKEVMAF